MGAVPLSFHEIDAYNRLTYASLSADEALLIRKMSSAYCSELNDRNPRKKPPYGEMKKPKVNGFVEALKAVAIVKTPDNV